MTIVLRKDVNRPLTWDELDGNFEDVATYTSQAQAAASSAQDAAQSVQGVVDNVAFYATQANQSASNAQDSADDAAQSASEISGAFDRTLRVPDGETIDPLQNRASRLSTLLGFDGTGDVSYTPLTTLPVLGSDGKIPASYFPTTIPTQADISALKALSVPVYNVKDPQFAGGAKGDWNSTTQTGTDDTAAIQAAINALTTTYRNGGLRYIYFPAGNYKITSLTIPAQSASDFGLMFIGQGRFASILWADNTNASPAIDSQLDFVHFQNMGLFGSLSQSTSSANWKSCFYKGKKSDNAPDIDVTFSGCALGHAVDFIQAYGRGVVIDNTCDAFFCTYLLNIVCDASTVFPGGATNSLFTGMRNYNISPRRTDVVSRFFRVTGNAPQKDYINDVSIKNVDILSADYIGEFLDGTITQLKVSGCTALNSFSAGLVNGKTLINADFDINSAKQYDRSVVSTGFMTGIVTLTGSFQNMIIRGNYRDLVSHVVQVGALSSGLVINIQVANLAVNGSAFQAVRGAQVNGATIDITAAGAAVTASCLFFDSTVQNNANFKCNAYGATFARPGVSYNPNLLIGSTTQTPTSRAGNYRIENGEANVNAIYQYTKTASTSSQVSVTLPVTPAAEFPSITATVSGQVSIKLTGGINTVVRGVIVPSSNSVIFYKADGSTLLESDLPAGAFTIAFSARYPV